MILDKIMFAIWLASLTVVVAHVVNWTAVKDFFRYVIWKAKNR